MKDYEKEYFMNYELKELDQIEMDSITEESDLSWEEVMLRFMYSDCENRKDYEREIKRIIIILRLVYKKFKLEPYEYDKLIELLESK